MGAGRPLVRVTGSELEVRVTATEGGTARACVLAGAQSLSRARRLLAGHRTPAGSCAAAVVPANRATVVRLPRPTGAATLAVRLAAETNPGRHTTSAHPVR